MKKMFAVLFVIAMAAACGGKKAAPAAPAPMEGSAAPMEGSAAPAEGTPPAETPPPSN